ncbi:hypothetical protein [Agromyces sp. NPDC058110]|uniref:hypothetical protein n=1 Tax=Agromyces sp. NPDC058110 TaxID=3346345 RepID=UPI0036DBCF55
MPVALAAVGLLLGSVLSAALAPAPAAADGVAAAVADGGADSTVTWSVTPSDTTGPDGRSRVELELDPGRSVTEHLAVRNLGTETVTFALTAADGYFTASGRFNMLASDRPSTGAGTWISIADSVTVLPGATAVVPFTVEVPSDATPGDHPAGVAASVTSVSDGDGAKVGVESRVGFRVMTRVTGELAPALLTTERGAYRISWNPLEPGSVVVSTELVNGGNVRLSAEPTVEVGGRTITPDGAEAGVPIELFPGDRRAVRFTVPAVWPIGPVTVRSVAEATTIEPDGSTNPIAPVQRTTSVWALPLPQLVVLVALALIVVGFVAGRRRQAHRVERLVADALAQGRREALDGRVGAA